MNLKDLEYLNPKSVLDIGANVGSFSKECKEVWPDCRIFMIEGNKECEAALKETGIPYVIALLSDKPKKVTFYQRSCGGTSTGDSIYLENTPWYAEESLVRTELMAYGLDGVTPLRTFDLIKLDVQGSELDILKGGPKVVEQAKHIIMEVPEPGVESYNIGAPTFEEVISYMDSIGFVTRKEIGQICHPIHRHIIQRDILFSRS